MSDGLAVEQEWEQPDAWRWPAAWWSGPVRVAWSLYACFVAFVAAWLAWSVWTFEPPATVSEIHWMPAGWMPSAWIALWWSLAILSLTTAPVYPFVGVLVFVALASSLPRYFGEAELLLRLHVLEWAAALAMLGWAVAAFGRGARPSGRLPGIAQLALALVAWISVSAVAALLGGRGWDPQIDHHPVLLLEAAALLLLASVHSIERANFQAVALVFTGALSARAWLFPETIPLDGDAPVLAVMALPLAVGAVRIAPHRLLRIGSALLAADQLRLIYVAQNRAAVVALASVVATGAFVWWYRSRLWALGSALIGATTIGLLMMGGVGQRFADIWQGGPNLNSVLSRLDIWRGGWQLVLEHPLFGVGPGNFSREIGRYAPEQAGYVAHNSFLQILAEFGAVGLLLYVLLFGTVLVQLVRTARRQAHEPWRRMAAGMLFASTVGYLVASCFISRHDLVVAYILAGLGASLARKPRSQVRRSTQRSGIGSEQSRQSADLGSGSKTMPVTSMRHRVLAQGLPLMAMTVSLGCGHLTGEGPVAGESPARFLREIDWAGKGTWLKADTHVHTKFSDGVRDVPEVVAKAALFGCDVLAITDHGDFNLKAASPEQAEAVAVARQSHPELIILAGIEWNLPGWGGDEHATVLLPPTSREWTTLLAFAEQFDDLDGRRNDPALVQAGLEWLAANGAAGGLPPVVIYDHPSRRRAISLEIIPAVQHWRETNDILVGLAGAPGHQDANPIGAYRYTEPTTDRWDPAVARVGDAWDQLLRQGIDLWAAHAPSDFHDAGAEFGDRWPGEFSETWLYAPDRSAAGALRAFRAGSFFGAHGHIVRDLELSVEAQGLPRPAMAGEVIELGAGADVTVRARFSVPPTDWAGKPNRIDAIELIAISAEGAMVVADRAPESGPYALSERVSVPAGGLVLRVRGRRIVENGPDLMFYSNPIRITVRAPRDRAE